MIEICFIVNATGVRVVREFYDERPALRLKNKLEHSKKCTLVYYMTYPF